MYIAKICKSALIRVVLDLFFFFFFWKLTMTNSTLFAFRALYQADRAHFSQLRFMGYWKHVVKK